MVKISVIIPTWNRAGTIEQCVQSVLAQTVGDLEVLVCDDGSTDNTRQIVESFHDPRVRWVEGTRGGRPAIPRNHGISEAKGEWLAFLDSDDQWLPDKLAKQLQLIEQHHVLAGCCNAIRFIPGQGEVGTLLNWEQEMVTLENLLQTNQVVCSSALVHQSLFNLVQGFPEEMGIIEDYACWLRVAALTDFIYLSDPLVIYRDESANSVRSTVTTEIWQQKRDVFADFLQWSSQSKVLDETKVRQVKMRYLLCRILAAKGFATLLAQKRKLQKLMTREKTC